MTSLTHPRTCQGSPKPLLQRVAAEAAALAGHRNHRSASGGLAFLAYDDVPGAGRIVWTPSRRITHAYRLAVLHRATGPRIAWRWHLIPELRRRRCTTCAAGWPCPEAAWSRTVRAEQEVHR